MKTSTIIKIADRIRSAYDISDPSDLCRQAGVILLYFPMGFGRSACKGFIIKQDDKVAITVSSDIDKYLQRVIMYHELAHYFLHIKSGIAETMQDFSIGSPASEMEFEADMLAAELSLDNDRVLSVLSDSCDFFEAAGTLDTLPEVLDFKLRVMRERGIRLPDSPIYTTGGFLRKVGTSA